MVNTCRQPRESCKAIVYVKDCYRRVGGPRHFAMHYNRRQCKRQAGANGYCWQHSWGGRDAPLS